MLTEALDSHLLDRTGAPGSASTEVTLPTFAQLADPHTIPQSIRERSRGSDPDEPDPLNLFRVHWYNAADRIGFADVPDHVVLPQELTGVEAPIIVAFGDRFPMIGAHKVLAAYACLAPRVVTGQFDPTRAPRDLAVDRQLRRGGVAISRIMGCRGVAILPAGHEPRALRRGSSAGSPIPADVIRTPGTESNVKEIYDACNALAQRPEQLRAQPVLRVRQPPRRTTRSPAGRSAHVFEHAAARSGRDLRLARVRRRPPARPAPSPPATV